MVVGVYLRPLVVLVLRVGLKGMRVRMRVSRIVMRMRMRVRMGVLVGVHGAIRMRVLVSMSMRVRLRMRVVLAAKDLVAWHVFYAVDDDVDFGGRNSGAFGATDLKFGPEVEFADGFAKEFRGDSGVNKCAEEHIAANA